MLKCIKQMSNAEEPCILYVKIVTRSDEYTSIINLHTIDLLEKTSDCSLKQRTLCLKTVNHIFISFTSSMLLQNKIKT